MDTYCRCFLYSSGDISAILFVFLEMLRWWFEELLIRVFEAVPRMGEKSGPVVRHRSWIERQRRRSNQGSRKEYKAIGLLTPSS
jgi:hypothetical protein